MLSSRAPWLPPRMCLSRLPLRPGSTLVPGTCTHTQSCFMVTHQNLHVTKDKHVQSCEKHQPVRNSEWTIPTSNPPVTFPINQPIAPPATCKPSNQPSQPFDDHTAPTPFLFCHLRDAVAGNSRLLRRRLQLIQLIIVHHTLRRGTDCRSVLVVLLRPEHLGGRILSRIHSPFGRLNRSLQQHTILAAACTHHQARDSF